MTRTVATVIDDIIRREGGAEFTNRAADKGGPTKFGITAATLGRWRQLGRDATADEVRALEEPEARAIYRAEYVEPFDWCPEPLRLLLVDFGVTSTHEAVFRALQFGLKYQGLYRGRIDGIVGPKTRAALSAVTDPRGLYVEVWDQRRRYYQALAFDAQTRRFLRDHPRTQLHNARGWNNRVAEFVHLVPDHRVGGVDAVGHSLQVT